MGPGLTSKLFIWFNCAQYTQYDTHQF